nr:polyprenyl synthetase family protein [Lachnospiraceae bacterium]
GQVVDIESEEKSADEVTMDTIRFIHENKTAAMIESSMMIGATLAGATKEEVGTIEAIGSDIGLAFQIRDDILDVVGSDETLGKPVGSDAKNGKVTYVSLVGLEAAKRDVRDISERAMTRFDSLSGSNTESGRFLRELIQTLIDRNS